MGWFRFWYCKLVPWQYEDRILFTSHGAAFAKYWKLYQQHQSTLRCKDVCFVKFQGSCMNCWGNPFGSYLWLTIVRSKRLNCIYKQHGKIQYCTACNYTILCCIRLKPDALTWPISLEDFLRKYWLHTSRVLIGAWWVQLCFIGKAMYH